MGVNIFNLGLKFNFKPRNKCLKYYKLKRKTNNDCDKMNKENSDSALFYGQAFVMYAVFHCKQSNNNIFYGKAFSF